MASELRFLIVGLGNPGPTYSSHRHNIGYRVVERLADRLGVTFSTADPACHHTVETQAGVILLKPQQYMNRSGEALVAWSGRQGIELTGSEDPEIAGLRPLIVCDDLALSLGSLRLRERGSSGGQNGLASLIHLLGGEEFPRLRLGIAGGEGTVPPEDWADYVLSPFLSEEQSQVDDLVDLAVRTLECVLDLGVGQAASRFNRRIRVDEDE